MVENSERLEPPRPAGIPDEVVVAPAAAAAGRPTWSGTGHCAIAGCVWPQLKHSHRCFREGCSFYVHNLCAQASLLDKDNPLNMYCSTTAKNKENKGRDLLLIKTSTTVICFYFTFFRRSLFFSLRLSIAGKILGTL